MIKEFVRSYSHAYGHLWMFVCVRVWSVVMCLQNKWLSGVYKHGQLCLCAVTLPIWYHESTLSKSPKCVLAYVCDLSWNSVRIVGNEKQMHHVSLSSSLSFEQMPHSSHIA